MKNYKARAEKIFSRIDTLAGITEDAGMLTRTFGSDAFIEAIKTVEKWMQEAGLQTRVDNIGNVRGRLHASDANAKTFIIASHIDSVVDAGKFDGPLGILIAIDLVENTVANGIELPFNVELIAFSDEEGVRFHTTYLGSKVLAGSFERDLLSQTDKDGITVREVIQKLGKTESLLEADALKAADVLGYFEVHIEQGPVLYNSEIPVAVVTGIAGQKRIELTFTGEAGHAGTVPMKMRQDALCCTAECILEIEEFTIDHKANVVATVGKLEIPNAASNVIPGKVHCTLDLRSPDSVSLTIAWNAIQNIITEISEDRKVVCEWKVIQETEPIACDGNLNSLLKQSIQNAGFEVVELVSGAGHDAVAISAICPVSMMFVRCYKGISHNPLESVELKDVVSAIEVGDDFLLKLSSFYNSSLN